MSPVRPRKSLATPRTRKLKIILTAVLVESIEIQKLQVREIYRPSVGPNMEEILVCVAMIIIIYVFMAFAYKKGW